MQQYVRGRLGGAAGSVWRGRVEQRAVLQQRLGEVAASYRPAHARAMRV